MSDEYFQKLKRSTWKKITITSMGTMMSIMRTEKSTLTSTPEDPTVATSPWCRQKVRPTPLLAFSFQCFVRSLNLAPSLALLDVAPLFCVLCQPPPQLKEVRLFVWRQRTGQAIFGP